MLNIAALLFRIVLTNRRIYIASSPKVKQLRMDKQVLEAHEAATSALKTFREAQGLTVERVEDTLDALAEVSSEQ